MPAPHVFLMRNRLKMIWVNAGSNPAQVVDFVTISHVADEDLVADALSRARPRFPTFWRE
jgi:hypothetical protein